MQPINARRKQKVYIIFPSTTCNSAIISTNRQDKIATHIRFNFAQPLILSTIPRMFKKRLIISSILLLTMLSAKCVIAMGKKPIYPNSLAELSINNDLPKPAQKDKQFIINAPEKSLIFYIGSRRLLFNNTIIMMNEPLIVRNKKAFLAPIDTTDTLTPLLAQQKLITQYPIKTVIIDPGHGGTDPGASGKNGLKEKDVVFDIAKRCKKKLEAIGIKAIMTRNNDKFIKLRTRPKMVTKTDADLFISIHANSSGNHAANGIETHILPATGRPCTAPSSFSKNACRGNKDNKMSVLLAYSIHKETLITTKASDRGVRRSRFSVLRNAPCPAILIECGFLSNQTEEKNLSSSIYRDKLATGIANGVKKLLK